MATTEQVTDVLRKVFSHARDLSVRDGVQSWDGNKWRIDDVLVVLREINTLAKTAKENYDIKFQPVEVWGGGQVAQPAMFLKENPLNNLQRMHEIAPDLELQCLYRGRQCFGFIPVSKEVQEAAIEAAAKRGMKVFRVFDMMNDLSNVETGIKAVGELKKKYKGLVVEGAISYISEPKGTKRRAWELDDYAQYAVKLAQLGSDEIAIKNYAGVGGEEMVPLVEKIHAALAQAGFQNMSVNLHIHGQKPELLVDVIKAGAGKVDTAFGELAGGPSHTNIRDLMNIYLREAGIDPSDSMVTSHPLVQQMAHIEKVIHGVVHRRDLPKKLSGNGSSTTIQESFNDRRAFLKKLTSEQIEHYRIAGGAYSDPLSRIQKELPLVQLQAWREKLATRKGVDAVAGYPTTQEEVLFKVFDKVVQLWEKAGRVNTVTPGAKIFIDQAMALEMEELQGKPPHMGQYIDAFADVVTGRFGVNQGMERGVGDVKFRDALLMYRVLRKLEEAKMSTDGFRHLAAGAHIGGDSGKRIFMNEGKIDLSHPTLEDVLKATNIHTFEHAIRRLHIDPQVKGEAINILTSRKSPEPEGGLDAGREYVRKALVHQPSVVLAPEKIEELALLAMILRRTQNGKIDYSVFDGMLKEQLEITTAAKDGFAGRFSPSSNGHAAVISADRITDPEVIRSML